MTPQINEIWFCADLGGAVKIIHYFSCDESYCDYFQVRPLGWEDAPLCTVLLEDLQKLKG